MKPVRIIRWSVFLLLAYAGFCLGAGVFLAKVTLHPGRRPLSGAGGAELRIAGADLQDVSVSAADGATLRGWVLLPPRANGNAVILLHGVSDNRLGMTGYARLFLLHGYTVLMPDSRAHGASDGDLATYGLRERSDVHRWFDLLAADYHPHCIYGLGESMGAAQLLQSLQEGTPFCAVVAESPFATFREIGYDRVGQFFHTGPWLGRSLLRPIVEVAFAYAWRKYGLAMDQVSPEDAVATSHVPVFLVHGAVDRNIPVRHSERIQARDPRVVLWEVPGADHCGGIAVAPQQFESAVSAWFLQHSGEQVYHALGKN